MYHVYTPKMCDVYEPKAEAWALEALTRHVYTRQILWEENSLGGRQELGDACLVLLCWHLLCSGHDETEPQG